MKNADPFGSAYANPMISYVTSVLRAEMMCTAQADLIDRVWLKLSPL
jgi:hypothetical protein